jgi:hypothetical protein
MRAPYNVEWLYKGMISKKSEGKILAFGAAFLGLQIAFACYLLFS